MADKRLIAAIENAGDDFARIAKLIDAAKRRRREKDADRRKRLTVQERAVWRAVDLLRDACRVEASIGRTEDRLGLRRSKPNQPWETRRQRIFSARSRSCSPSRAARQ
jgi:hypothetical protein